jgi:hypothetical protein
MLVLHATMLVLHATMLVWYSTMLVLHDTMLVLHRTMLVLHATMLVLHRTMLVLHCTMLVWYSTMLVLHATMLILHSAMLVFFFVFRLMEGILHIFCIKPYIPSGTASNDWNDGRHVKKAVSKRPGIARQREIFMIKVRFLSGRGGVRVLKGF